MKNDAVYHGVFPPQATARVIAAAVVTLLFNVFLFHRIGPVALTIAIFELAAFVSVAMCRHDAIRKHRAAVLAVSVVIWILLGIMVCVANGFVTMLAFLVALASVVLLGYVLSGTAPFVESLSEFLLIPLRMIGPYVVGAFSALSFLHRAGAQGKTTGWGRSLLVGLIVGLPIAFILIGMFSGADPIFSHAVSGWLKQQVTHELVTRLFFSTMIFAFLVPLIFLRRHQSASPISFIISWSFDREMTVIMTLVAMVVGAFLVIQWPYIFAQVAAETNLSQFGVATYSEYVKKGFGELLWIAFTLYGLLWGGLLALRGRKPSNASLLPFAQGIVLTETLVFVLSIFRRIWLYQTYHGWTLVRIYGGVFLFWVTFMLITLAARHIWQRRWIVRELAISALLVLLLGTWNAEHFIATTHPPTVNHRVDHLYLVRMSADGVEGWRMAYDSAKRTLENPLLVSKPLLDMNDRRDIYNAGDITRRLMRRYESMAAVYADGFTPAYEVMTQQGQQRKYDRLDKLFMWNASRSHAFYLMTKDMPYETLKQLVKKYEVLEKKILMQPADEQGYAQDVSYNSPFLESY